jgi:hypothetical protein
MVSIYYDISNSAQHKIFLISLESGFSVSYFKLNINIILDYSIGFK